MSLRLSGGRRLRSPEGSLARPTAARVRLAVMNLLAAELPGCRWLDLCCGSGVMACEALQRGAETVVAVERHRRHADLARANLTAVQAGLPAPAPGSGPRVQVVADEVVRWLKQGRRGLDPFQLIYADPPYASGLYGPIAEAVAAQGWLAAGGTMVWECATATPPEVPEGWQCSDQRRYGSCALMLLRPICA
jgi:16S rRNA (guanine(966)-N(2))-methyltransferase RsmD